MLGSYAVYRRTVYNQHQPADPDRVQAAKPASSLPLQPKNGGLKRVATQTAKKNTRNRLRHSFRANEQIRGFVRRTKSSYRMRIASRCVPALKTIASSAASDSSTYAVKL